MFRVTADSLEAYLDFDPDRKRDLLQFHEVMVSSAPALKRYFHEGTPAGEPGMRMKMIGYGKTRYATGSGKTVEWPAIGLALQKNYISVYVSLMKGGQPLANTYAGKLGELRMGGNNFSFVRFDDLNSTVVSALAAEADSLFRAGPENSVR